VFLQKEFSNRPITKDQDALLFRRKKCIYYSDGNPSAIQNSTFKETNKMAQDIDDREDEPTAEEPTEGGTPTEGDGGDEVDDGCGK
jgi:hypothetical protein